MFFDSWSDIQTILIAAICAYIGIVFILRVSGKRTLSKMNAFDFIVTVAFGSTLSATILNSSVSLSEGLLAFALLALLQICVTKLSSIFPPFEKIIKAEPVLLYHQGKFMDENMKAERLSPEEVYSSIRENGIGRMADVEAIVLETNGSMSILKKSPDGPSDIMEQVKGYKT